LRHKGNSHSWAHTATSGRSNLTARQDSSEAIYSAKGSSYEYFKTLAEETGIPYQNLIDLYLRECAQTGKKPDPSWAS
jgi:hypothetical protein